MLVAGGTENEICCVRILQLVVSGEEDVSLGVDHVHWGFRVAWAVPLLAHPILVEARFEEPHRLITSLVGKRLSIIVCELFVIFIIDIRWWYGIDASIERDLAEVPDFVVLIVARIWTRDGEAIAIMKYLVRTMG